MLHAKNYQDPPVFHKVIQKITVAHFLLRHGVLSYLIVENVIMKK